MPTLYLISGMPGAGKTTLAKRLAREHSAARFEPDAWLAALNVKPITTELRRRVEHLQWEMASDLLRLGTNVILENGFWVRKEREELLHMARGLGAKVELHVLDTHIDIRWERIEKRNPTAAIGEITREQLVSWEPYWERPDIDELAKYDRGQFYQ